MDKSNRRAFLKQLATSTGAVVLMPLVTSCKKQEKEDEAPTEKPEAEAKPAETTEEPKAEPAAEAKAEIPQTKPEGWDPIAYNRERGNAGAIPESYRESINGPDGEKKHLGKHLPYIPEVDASLVPEGFIAIMWGNPELGYTRHPNAPRSEANNNEGHWYNWIKLRKATDEEAEELQSTYTDWPGNTDEATGKYAVFGGGDITADSGKNTIYMAALPPDVQPGDTVRVWAHCLTHGEYVDFITV